jgi:3-methyladenine DNA glycosylase/8-oxoguanine DNA glycosylase
LLVGLPRDLGGALVLQVIGQQLSIAAAGAILARLEALRGGRLPSPAELLGIDAETLRGIGMSGAKSVYLHDLARAWRMAASIPSGWRPSTTTKPGPSSCRSRAWVGSPPRAS